ncbi:MAG: hypothetical protein U0838_14020 [Chloroflexota bacterium]
MKKLIAPIIGAGLAALVAVGAASAATPAPSAPAPVVSAATSPAPTAAPAVPAAGTTLSAILGLSNAEIMALRQQGLSLAQIAERQKVDPQKLIDALVAQWSARVDARLAVGAITADQAKTLKANLAVQAKGMVYQVTLGGMRGSAVGAGPNGAMRGMGGAASGTAGSGAGAMGQGRGAMMRGGAAGANCVLPSASPSN